MLIPHNPSKNLHRSGQLSTKRRADLDDVHIIEIPLAEAPREAEVGRAKMSGRAARLNPYAPIEKDEGRRP